MRIPWRHIYRAFPELDAFSDAECERFVALARRREWLWEIVTGIVAIVAMLGVYLLVANVWRLAAVTMPRGWRQYIGRTPAVFVMLLMPSLLTGPVVALMIRDAWLRWAIQRNLDITKCVGCGYSLLGLPVDRGRVRCPECGRDSTLAEMGITAEELLPRGGRDPDPEGA